VVRRRPSASPDPERLCMSAPESATCSSVSHRDWLAASRRMQLQMTEIRSQPSACLEWS